MSTTIFYNGVTIWNVQTNMITQEPVRDQTDSDHIRNRTTISATGILHRKQLSTQSTWKLGVEVASTTGANDLGLFRGTLESLNTPRKRFILFIGSERIWDIVPLTSYLRESRSSWEGSYTESSVTRPEIRNGPQVEARITRVVGEHSAHVEFTITFDYLPCSSGTNWMDHISSLRWWVNDDIDCATWLISRTYRGRLEVKERTISPHWWQAVVLPPLLYGFKRKRISYEQSEDGFALDFTITDQQVYAQAPPPAVDWGGTVSLSSPFGGAGTKEVTVNVTMSGHRGSSKLHMLTNMVYIMATKTKWLSRTASIENIGFFPKLLEFEESLSENTCRGMLVGEFVNAMDDFVEIIRDMFGTKLDYNAANPVGEQGIPNYDSLAPTYYLHDTSTIANIFVAGIQNACQHNRYIQGGYEVSPGTGAPGTSGSPGGGMTDGDGPAVVAAPQTALSTEGTAPYMLYRLTSEYDIDERLLGLPSFATDQFANRTQYYRMAAPQAVRRMSFEGSRLNKWPVMPNRTSWTDPETNITHTVLSSRMKPNAVVIGADGATLLYTAAADVVYGLSRAPTNDESLKVGMLPFMTGQGEGNLASIVSFPGSSRVPGVNFETAGNNV